jgi:hypothetical protein
MQTRLGSFIEANVNVIIGFTFGVIVNSVAIVLMEGYPATVIGTTSATVMTVQSLIRQYFVRRYFNG